jgi:hypothetical protein
MPIRFRCVYCNQLLGISRRKAGTIVRCTSCEGQLIVPEPIEGPTEPAKGPQLQEPAAPEPPPASKPDIFEQGDFDALLEPYRSGSPAAVASPPKPPASRPKDASPSPAPSSLSPATQSAGLVLSRTQLTVVSVVLVLTLGLAFAGGLLLGLSLRGG